MRPPEPIDTSFVVDMRQFLFLSSLLHPPTIFRRPASAKRSVSETACQLNVLSAKCAVSETTKQEIFVSETVCQLIDQSAKRPVS